MFAYCLNNPINMADNTGNLPFFVVSAAIGAVVGAVIKGVKRLRGTIIEAHDLRGGAALIIAGLIANGKTKIIGIRHILRGYEYIDDKIRTLGGNIIRSE